MSDGDFDVSFCVIYLFHRKRSYVWFWWQYKVHSLFIISRPSINRNSIEYRNFTNFYWKSIRIACLGKVKHDWTSIFSQSTNRKYFLFVRGNIWYSKVAFYNKTTCLLRHRCFNRDLSVVTISYYSFLVLYLHAYKKAPKFLLFTQFFLFQQVRLWWFQKRLLFQLFI